MADRKLPWIKDKYGGESRYIDSNTNPFELLDKLKPNFFILYITNLDDDKADYDLMVFTGDGQEQYRYKSVESIESALYRNTLEQIRVARDTVDNILSEKDFDAPYPAKINAYLTSRSGRLHYDPREGLIAGEGDSKDIQKIIGETNKAIPKIADALAPLLNALEKSSDEDYTVDLESTAKNLPKEYTVVKASRDELVVRHEPTGVDIYVRDISRDTFEGTIQYASITASYRSGGYGLLYSFDIM